MKIHLDKIYNETLPALLSLLNESDAPYTEYRLMQDLAKRGYKFFARDPDAGSNLSLFRRHFVLFHCLYRMQEDLLPTHFLNINCLNISISSISSPSESRAISDSDPTKGYYLDPSHLEETNASDVEEMLNDFWTDFGRLNNRDTALEKLGLGKSADKTEIRDTYRRLAMQNHPDRGGDAAKFREIQQAYQQLK